MINDGLIMNYVFILNCKNNNYVCIVFSDMLRRSIVEIIASMMVLPNKFPIKLSDVVESDEIKTPEPEVII